MGKCKKLGILAVCGATSYFGLRYLIKSERKKTRYELEPSEKNKFEGKIVVFVPDKNDKENADGKKGHLKAIGNAQVVNKTNYQKYIKRALDVAVSLGGLVVLSPLYAGIALAIKLDDPGPSVFTQKRVGENKQYFKLHKFRSMKMSTPNNIPTHMMKNPDEYITRVGKLIRKFSLDELPQIWDIFVGNMSFVGPRPALWNQETLIAERDKYGVYVLKPGLTGWAQINGRDAISIEEKAKFDGEYVANESLSFDANCIKETAKQALSGKDVVEGGPASISSSRWNYLEGKTDKEIIGNIGFGEEVVIDKTQKINLLITGKNSYIGNSVEQYIHDNNKNITVDKISLRNSDWENKNFGKYDAVLNVAGIAHSDVGNASDSVRESYYKVNTDLAIKVAEKAKLDGVKQFIQMSSMIIYGAAAPLGQDKIITKNTVPYPENFYGDSKLQSDVQIRSLATKDFNVVVIRPPMIYGPGCKGNYLMLEKITKLSPVFPKVNNKRSIVHINNLCELICHVVFTINNNEHSVVLMPQDEKIVSTSDIVLDISKINNYKIHITRSITPALFIFKFIPGKLRSLCTKAFGSFAYDKNLECYKGKIQDYG